MSSSRSSLARSAPSETPRAGGVAGGGLEQHLAAEGHAESRDAIALDARLLGEPVERRTDCRLCVGAEEIRAAVAVAVAGEVDRQHAIAVARDEIGLGGDVGRSLPSRAR